MKEKTTIKLAPFTNKPWPSKTKSSSKQQSATKCNKEQQSATDSNTVVLKSENNKQKDEKSL
ncbi:hypothetical protein [Tenacibaculum aiptasiae]|uniref:hypothetical protein n=1 Tax=Tenacibaculum aiptasiae TaxID=426481 RepID=UPI00232EBE0A|nr:hypothetical protein [Tenacibaculum aiptasiae]